MDATEIKNGTNLGISRKDPNIWKAAQSLESNFIFEMLKSAGLGKTGEEFSGGTGEDQFSSFLTQEYSVAMIEAGGIGLAESIYQSIILKGGED